MGSPQTFFTASMITHRGKYKHINCNHCNGYIRIATPKDLRQKIHLCSKFCEDNYKRKERNVWQKERR